MGSCEARLLVHIVVPWWQRTDSPNGEMPGPNPPGQIKPQ